jgi:hypothetical protein
MDKFLDYINYYGLILLTNFKILYNKILRFITDTKEIKSFDKNTETTSNLIWRYYMIRFLDYCVLFFKNTRKNLDINVDKIQIIKNYKEGKRTIILDSEMSNNKITITNLIKHIDNKTKINNKSINTNFLVFVKFELHDPPNKPVCLKEYLVKYKDTNQFHHHTLKNIISFNNVNIVNPDAYINISFIKNSKIEHLKIPFHNIHDLHINDFHKPEIFLEN